MHHSSDVQYYGQFALLEPKFEGKHPPFPATPIGDRPYRWGGDFGPLTFLRRDMRDAYSKEL